jgi:hypothetical protein
MNITKNFEKFNVEYVFDEEFSVQLLLTGTAVRGKKYNITDTGDIPVNLDRYNDCINFTFTYKVLGILKTGIGTIDKEGNLVLEGQLCSHREMKEVKGLVPIYLEAGTPTE